MDDGALWQMATPSNEVAQLYREDPRLGHAIVDVEPRLTRILTPLLTGRRLFDHANPKRLTLTRSIISSTGYLLVDFQANN
jgi:hypothetical protein